MRFLALLFCAAALWAGPEEAQRRRPEVERAIAKMTPTIVRIEVISEDGADGRMLRQHSVGSAPSSTPKVTW